MPFSRSSSERFASRRSPTRSLTWHSSLSDELAEALWCDPDALSSLGEPLQDKERCLVVRLSDGPDSLVLKRHNWGGLWKTFCKSLRTPQARQSFHDGVFLAQSGVRTPMPLALVEHKLGPFGRRSYLLTKFVRGTSLYRMMRFERPPRELVRYVAQQLVAILARLVELRVSHNDLKPENLMIDAAGQVWLIDLEKFRRHTSLEQVHIRLMQDLARFLHPRNWSEDRESLELFRQQLLQHPTIAAAAARIQSAEHPLLDTRCFDTAQRNKLSVLIVSPSDTVPLRTCIDSIRDIADEIIVADHRPTCDAADDREASDGQWLRPEVAEAAAAFQNRALAEARHPWVLVVEGQERVSPDLAKEIQCLLANHPRGDAFRIPRRRTYLGHVSKYGAFRREAPLRLVRRGSGTFVEHRMRARLEAKVQHPERLKSKLICLAGGSLTELVRSTNDHTTRLAQLRHQQGEHPKLLAAIVRAARRFLKNYLAHHAILDGRIGLQLSLFPAYSALLTEMKLWELHHAKKPHWLSEEPCGETVRLFGNSDRTVGDSPEVAADAPMEIPDCNHFSDRIAS